MLFRKALFRRAGAAALSLLVAGAAALGGLGVPGRAAAATSESVLYSFKNGADGSNPFGKLTPLNGLLYGTTFYGGKCCGTVFSVSLSGAFATVYSFTGGADGADPFYGLTLVNNTFYGTTYLGGTSFAGTIYSLTPGGTETVLHSFNGADGGLPASPLATVGTTFYGTTQYGGTYGLGTVFQVSPLGFQTLYSFKGGADGANPQTGISVVGAALYGTTAHGGTGCAAPGCGTVFTITPAGVETVVASFTGGNGSSPISTLANVGGVLFGTTIGGGTHGLGTVFKVTLAGLQTVYSFRGGKDGANPFGPVIPVGTTLYGTTVNGGGTGCGGFGCGTLYKISPTTGAESVTYAFQGQPDGAGPVRAPAVINGRLYGVTVKGGAFGFGSVYAIVP